MYFLMACRELPERSLSPARAPFTISEVLGCVGLALGAPLAAFLAGAFFGFGDAAAAAAAGAAATGEAATGVDCSTSAIAGSFRVTCELFAGGRI